jgi:hypothetical protein
MGGGESTRRPLSANRFAINFKPDFLNRRPEIAKRRDQKEQDAEMSQEFQTPFIRQASISLRIAGQ